MNKITNTILQSNIIILMMLISCPISAQNHLDKIMDFLGEKRTNLGLEARDANDFIVLDNFITSHNQINHIYLQQTIGGIPIENAILNFNIASNGTILNYYNRTSPDASGRVVGDVSLSSENAILNVLSSSERTSCSQSEFLTYDPIIQIPNNTETELIYKDKGQEGIIPVWRVVLNDNEYKIRVDVCATTGRILERKNLVLAFSDNEKKKNSSKKTRNNFDVKKMMLSGIPKYLVFPQSVENPNQGARTEVENPSFSLASPLGWHNDGNVEFTSTQGNNILVKENITGDNSGGTSEGTSDLDFSFSLDLNESPTENIIVQNVDAAITNAFYWANLMHDIWYMYGFDEASGNFQENNFDKGGIGLDAVEIKILDGSGMGNSYFSTTEEGRNPEMVLQIYEDENGDLYNSAFDNGIIAHEYAHGITTRLTGGASTVTCLENEEQMGEGWSDYFALVMTQKKTDINTTSRSLGSYVLGQGVDDLGFRPYPYSTSKAVNPVTYSDVSNTEDFTVPHGVGFIFATMIWDLYWDFIREYGYDEDLYQGKGGNNICHQLIMDALKLQACSPGFVDARDAIILADEINNDGTNRCLIWQSFARRGLGYSASQGSPFSRMDQVAAYDLPPDVSGVKIEQTADVSSANEGDVITFRLNITSECVDAYGVEIRDFLPANLEYIPGSASDDVQYTNGELSWSDIPFLPKGEEMIYTYKAAVKKGAFTLDGNTFSDEMTDGSNWFASSSLGQNKWLLHPSGYWWASEPALEDYDFEHQFLSLNLSQELTGYSELSFTHEYNTEQHWDGGTLEISVDGGTTWQDAGTYMTENGYNDYIANRGERPAFSGNSNGRINTRLDLSSFSCEAVLIRFNFYYDKYQAGEGWRIYDVLLKTESGAFNIAQTKTIEGVVSQSSACISITDPSNLPIEWGEVTATAKENEFIRLDWNTITEENNLGFEIERYSEESDVFHQVSFVEGQGNSLEETDYVFDDSNVYPGVLYHYRIKQLDLNGDYNYSDIVSAKVDVTRLMVSVFPNPVLDGSLNLSITNPTDEADFKVEIFSSEGKLMQNSSYELAQNHQILNLDVSRLSKGMYIVRMSNFSFSQVEQLIIR